LSQSCLGLTQTNELVSRLLFFFFSPFLYFPKHMLKLLALSFRIFRRGVGGQTTHQIISQFSPLNSAAAGGVSILVL
jgi:hypothetical protein